MRQLLRVLAIFPLLLACAIDDRPPPAPTHGHGTITGGPRLGAPIEPQVAPPEGVEPEPDETIDGLSPMRGDLGAVVDFAATPHTVVAESTTGWAYVELHADDGVERNVMVAIIVDGGLDHPALVPGAELTFGAWDLREPDALDLDIGILGCSGPEPGFWIFDVFAKDVVVRVEEGESPDDNDLTFEGTFDGGYGDQQFEGTITYQNPHAR